MSGFTKLPLTDNELTNLLTIQEMNEFNKKFKIYNAMKTISPDQLQAINEHIESYSQPTSIPNRRWGGMKTMRKRRRGTRRGGRRNFRKRRSCKKH